MTEAALADCLWVARRDGWLLEAEDRTAGLDVEAAYRVQQGVLDRWLAARPEDRVAGWKLGYTSQVMRDQMGIAEPNYGPLLASMVRGPGEPLPTGLRHPRVEPEIALVVGTDLTEPTDTVRLREAVTEVRPALEIVDSSWVGYRFTLAANTADLSSAAGVVLGPPFPGTVDPAEVSVELRADGTAVAQGHSSAAMGGPFEALAWLVARVVGRGEMLAAGSVVMTGGLTAAHPLGPGTRIEAAFSSGSTGSRISVGR